MGTRTLARQFLGWQLAVVVLLLAAVAGIAVVQQNAAFRETQGRRMLSLAEDVAATPTVREGLAAGRFDGLAPLATSARNISGADEIVIVDGDGIVRTAGDPAQVGSRFVAGGSTAAAGRAWVGNPDGRTVDAQVPVIDAKLRVVGVVAARVRAPSLLATLAPLPTAALLGIALVIGVAGSLLLARRVRKQTLGLEPAEIVELVQRQEAMLLGVKEGVVAMDGAHRITLLNDAARTLLDIPATVRVGDLDERLRDVLTGAVPGEDQLVLRGSRVLVLNRMPVVVHGEEVGAVVTLRDRTELAALEHRLDASRHVTDTLRAQTHEFANRLHTIAGLTELGEYDEVRRFVAAVVAGSDQWRREVTTQVGDPAAAALLVAKASLATERGVELRLAPATRLGAGDPALSADLVTVLGNLVDNAIDAVAAGPEPRWVEVGVSGPDPVTVTVRDSGPGVADGLAEEVFRHGFTTKAAEGPGGRGLGLALARQVCLRRGGTIAVHNETGAVFTATLPSMMRVLVVDDDFMVARVHSGYVARIPGCEVVGVAHTAADAVEQSARLRPDLVLLDVYLPDASGLDVLRALRTGKPDDPFVLMITAADDTATVTAALHGGATHYLVKPFDSRALQEQVERVSRVRGKLAGLHRAAQDDIDSVFGGRPGATTRLPKGLGADTARLVERALREHGGDVSASECAELTELSRVSARRYLEHFVGTGAVTVGLRYGTGRPERRYRWAGHA